MERFILALQEDEINHLRREVYKRFLVQGNHIQLGCKAVHLDMRKRSRKNPKEVIMNVRCIAQLYFTILYFTVLSILHYTILDHII